MRTFLFFFSTILILCSVGCTKHEAVIDTSLQVGHILCSDGSILHPEIYEPNSKTAIGIIFWVNDGKTNLTSDKALAVSLVDLDAAILIDSDKDISNVSENMNSFDGAGNTTAIMVEALKDSLDYPAVKSAVEYSPNGVTGWYIGSVAQNKAVASALSKIIKPLQNAGGTEFEGWYWSSTEDGAGKDNPQVFGMITSLNEGMATASSKTNKFKVRPIISIR